MIHPFGGGGWSSGYKTSAPAALICAKERRMAA
jgi:hypothetical protein